MVTIPVARFTVEVPLGSTTMMLLRVQLGGSISAMVYFPGVSAPLFQVSPLAKLKVPLGVEVIKVKLSSESVGQVVFVTVMVPGGGGCWVFW